MQHRIDIQSLRGVAVLLVVLYHAKLFWVEGGFLGVDIFFVISGFLITSQIYRRLQNNTFSFREFYLQRAWRLLPAAYIVFMFCCVFAPFLLTTIELNDFKEQLLGAVTFTANIVLWSQTGYFEEAADIKPLLHTWSLSIEEQYYLIIPALLWLLRKNKHCLTIFIILTLASFMMMSIQMPTMPGAMFYLTPARAWEIGIGSILAIFVTNSSKTLPNWFGYIGIFIIISLPYKILVVGEHTEVNLLIVTLATVFIIGANIKDLENNVITRILAKIGDISYSLYLVHWPIIAFANSAKLHDNNFWWPLRIGMVIASFLLAWLLHHFIESRFRITQNSKKRAFIPLIIVSILLILLVLFITKQAHHKYDYANEFRPNIGFSEACDYYSVFTNSASCKNSATPEIMVWGDSFAMHLIPGLIATTDKGITQSTKSTCAPLPSISIINLPKRGMEQAENCIEFNQSVLNHIVQSQSLEIVVLASQWGYLFNSEIVTNTLTKTGNEKLTSTEKTNDQLAQNLITLVKAIQSLGKKVIVISPPPVANFDIAKCHERLETKKWRVGGNKNCDIYYPDFIKRTENVISLMASVKQANIPVYSFTEKLCDESKCETKLDEIILYRDNGHLSVNGSKHYAEHFSLYQELQSLIDMPISLPKSSN